MTSGEAFLSGYNVVTQHSHACRYMGFCPQFAGLIGGFVAVGVWVCVGLCACIALSLQHPSCVMLLVNEFFDECDGYSSVRAHAYIHTHIHTDIHMYVFEKHRVCE